MGYAAWQEGATVRTSFLGVSLLCGLLFFVALFCWSLASPIGSGVDEPAHVIKAVGSAHHQGIGIDGGKGLPSAVRLMRVPAAFASKNWTCFHLHLTDGAGCVRAQNSATLVSAPTAAARYFPAYYAAVGLPSLFGHSTGTIYLMRVMSDLLSAIMLGIAAGASLCYGRSRLMSISLLVAMSPTAFYLGSVVNPNGLEISAGIAAWVTWLVMMQRPPGDSPRSLEIAAFSSVIVLTLCRSLSPIWALLIILSTIALSPYRSRDFLTRRSSRIGIALLGLAVVIQSGWTLVAKSYLILGGAYRNPRHPPSTWQYLLLDLGRIPDYLEQSVGILGWLNLGPPSFTYFVWVMVAGAMCLVAMGVSRSREVAVLVSVILASLLISIALDVWNSPSNGLVWQARYTMPFAVGIPIVAGFCLGRIESLERSRLPALIGGLVAVGALVEWWRMVSTYVVGTRSWLGPLSSTSGRWAPSISFQLLAVALLLASCSLVWILARGPRTESPADEGTLQEIRG